MQSFEQTLAQHGIPIPKQPIGSNSFTRWGERQGDTRYFAKRTEDGEAIIYGDWSAGVNEVWFPQEQSILTPEQRQERMRRAEAAKAQAEAERQREQEEAATQALERWNTAAESGKSTYLECKKVQAFGLRYSEHGVMIPLCDADGKLWSLQTISAEGEKRFLPGGKKKGCFHTIGDIGNARSVYVCEGYATAASVHMATNTPAVVAFDAGNLEPVVAALKAKYPGIAITIAADNDQWKEVNTGKEKAVALKNLYGVNVALPEFSDAIKEHKPTDFNDLHVLEGLGAVKGQLVKRLHAITLHDFMAMDIKPQEWLLEPIIPKQGLGMLYAYRGMGKTFVSLGIAYAVASGSNFLKWEASQPHRVLLIDGEMPARSLQERLAGLIASNEREVPSPEYLRIITPDLQEKGIPSLHTPEGQEALEPYLKGVSLVIIDNISTLCRGGRENEAESWLPVQEWALSLRRRGISILFIHHSGKNEQQRGTSRREDVLDTVIVLKRPKDYEASQGARFEVHYEKHRNFYGDDAKPFEASLQMEGNSQKWMLKDLEDARTEQIIELAREGLKQREIAIELGIGVGTVNRALKKAKEEGIYAGK